MTTNVKLKESFEIESKHGAFYTGGSVEWHENILYCQTKCNISLLDVETGLVSKYIGEENSEEADFIQTFTTDGQQLVSSHKSGLLKLWNQENEVVKMWKYIHKGPIAKLVLNGLKLASGGSDGVVRIWDLVHQACTLSLKGCQGVINVVKFHPTNNVLFASGDDGKIVSWDLLSGDNSLLYNAHYSKVTSIVFSNDGKHFVSSARDKVLILWELGKPHALKTIAVYETIEVLVCLPLKFKLPNFKPEGDGLYVASAGDNGIVKVWDIKKSKEVFSQTNSLVNKATEEGGLAITNLLYNEKQKAIAVVSSDQNIIIHNLKSFICLKQFIGFSDEILDIVFLGKNDSHLAVATNSNDIKLYDNATMNCQLLKGHTDLVLSLAVSRSNPNLLLSAGKDNKIRLWLLNEEDYTMKCVGIGTRHTGSVGSVSISNQSSKFAVSVSQDTCVKVWELPEKFTENSSLNCLYTEIGHEKDINCVTVSPNDKLIATASQDKTAKLWNDSLSLFGVLRGHTRGVWSVRFSPVDQVVVTSSADCTVKLWSVTGFCCLKTLTGHDSSILKAEFISNGLQILTAGADGILKMFSLKTFQCSSTFKEGHDGRIFALAIKKDESGLVSGGSDSLLIKWKDMTEERKIERQKEVEELALQEQKLSNYIQNNNLLKAMKLAIRLDRPFQVLKIVKGIIKTGDTGLADTIKSLRNDQKNTLCQYAIKWNLNGKHCHPAHLVMNVLVNEMQTGDFTPHSLSSTIEESLPYTERQFKRLTQLMQDYNFVNYTFHCMLPHAKSVNSSS